MNRVAIVVLNWNGIEDTLECLKSLERQTYSSFHVVVVDNGSIDDSKVKLDAY
jgi:GT2 family glycosyltransferase